MSAVAMTTCFVNMLISLPFSFWKRNLNMGNSQLQCFFKITDLHGGQTPFFTSNFSLMIWNNYKVQYWISPSARNCVQVTNSTRSSIFLVFMFHIEMIYVFRGLKKKIKKITLSQLWTAIEVFWWNPSSSNVPGTSIWTQYSSLHSVWVLTDGVLPNDKYCNCHVISRGGYFSVWKSKI